MGRMWEPDGAICCHFTKKLTICFCSLVLSGPQSSVESRCSEEAQNTDKPEIGRKLTEHWPPLGSTWTHLPSPILCFNLEKHRKNPCPLFCDCSSLKQLQTKADISSYSLSDLESIYPSQGQFQRGVGPLSWSSHRHYDSDSFRHLPVPVVSCPCSEPRTLWTGNSWGICLSLLSEPFVWLYLKPHRIVGC